MCNILELAQHHVVGSLGRIPSEGPMSEAGAASLERNVANCM